MKSACKRYRGRCCKQSPGCYHPDQLDMTNLPAMFASGLGVVKSHFFQGRELVLCVRAPGVNDKLATWWLGDNPCALLTEHGCKLSPGDRPRECQGLHKPKRGRCHHAHGCDRDSLLAAWKPYHSLLEAK